MHTCNGMCWKHVTVHIGMAPLSHAPSQVFLPALMYILQCRLFPHHRKKFRQQPKASALILPIYTNSQRSSAQWGLLQAEIHLFCMTLQVLGAAPKNARLGSGVLHHSALNR